MTMRTHSPLATIRQKLALAVGENAVFDGWAAKAVDSAATAQGVDAAQARLAFPKTAAGLIDCYISAVDRALEQRFSPKALNPRRRNRVRGHGLQRHLASDQKVLRFVDDAHRAFADGMHDLIAPVNDLPDERIARRAVPFSADHGGGTITDHA